MLTYKQMRAALKASPEGVKLKNFTEAFYNTFCEAWKTKDWTPVHATEFYKLDGFSYCVFLELFTASLPRWRLTFGRYDAFHWPVDITHQYINEDTEDDARAAGMEMLGRFSADYVEVMKVA